MPRRRGKKAPRLEDKKATGASAPPMTTQEIIDCLHENDDRPQQEKQKDADDENPLVMKSGVLPSAEVSLGAHQDEDVSTYDEFEDEDADRAKRLAARRSRSGGPPRAVLGKGKGQVRAALQTSRHQPSSSHQQKQQTKKQQNQQQREEQATKQTPPACLPTPGGAGSTSSDADNGLLVVSQTQAPPMPANVVVAHHQKDTGAVKKNVSFTSPVAHHVAAAGSFPTPTPSSRSSGGVASSSSSAQNSQQVGGDGTEEEEYIVEGEIPDAAMPLYEKLSSESYYSHSGTKPQTGNDNALLPLHERPYVATAVTLSRRLLAAQVTAPLRALHEQVQ